MTWSEYRPFFYHPMAWIWARPTRVADDLEEELNRLQGARNHPWRWINQKVRDDNRNNDGEKTTVDDARIFSVTR